MITLSISSVAIFCDDVRDEVAGTSTIVGVLPDNIEVPEVPRILPRLGVLVRTQIGVDALDSDSPLIVRLHLLGDMAPIVIENESASIKETLKLSVEQGSPFGTFYTRILLAPFNLASVGQIRATVQYGKSDEIIAGILNVRISAST